MSKARDQIFENVMKMVRQRKNIRISEGGPVPVDEDEPRLSDWVESIIVYLETPELLSKEEK